MAKESLILSAFKQKILDKIEQSKGIKPKKNLLFQDFFVGFFLTKKVFVRKCHQKLCIPFT